MKIPFLETGLDGYELLLIKYSSFQTCTILSIPMQLREGSLKGQLANLVIVLNMSSRT